MGLNFLAKRQANPQLQLLGGRYQIIRQLGRGGFGQTFLAQDTHLPGYPTCVVKQLKPQARDRTSLQVAQRLFDTEAQTLYQLGSHDQIPRLLAHFEDESEFYLVQEYVVGETLSGELVEKQPWSESKVIHLLQDILQVLAFVHQQRVIHRDIKPSNLIRRTQDGRIVLIDFGAVKQASTQVIQAQPGQAHTIAIGTHGYMPNEQLAGSPRFSSDVYAVGMIGIQALTGLSPKRFNSDPRTGEICWQSWATSARPALLEVLSQMVRYDCRDRYPSATEALAAIASLDPAAVSASPSPRPPAIAPTPNQPESTEAIATLPLMPASPRGQVSSAQTAHTTVPVAPPQPAPSPRPAWLPAAGAAVALLGLAFLSSPLLRSQPATGSDTDAVTVFQPIPIPLNALTQAAEAPIVPAAPEVQSLPEPPSSEATMLDALNSSLREATLQEPSELEPAGRDRRKQEEQARREAEKQQEREAKRQEREAREAEKHEDDKKHEDKDE